MQKTPLFLCRSVPINVLDGCFVAPRDVVSRQVEHRRNEVAFLRAGCPSTEDNCQNALLVETRTGSQIVDADFMFAAKIAHAF